MDSYQPFLFNKQAVKWTRSISRANHKNMLFLEKRIDALLEKYGHTTSSRSHGTSKDTLPLDSRKSSIRNLSNLAHGDVTSCSQIRLDSVLSPGSVTSSQHAGMSMSPTSVTKTTTQGITQSSSSVTQPISFHRRESDKPKQNAYVIDDFPTSGKHSPSNHVFSHSDINSGQLVMSSSVPRGGSVDLHCTSSISKENDKKSNGKEKKRWSLKSMLNPMMGSMEATLKALVVCLKLFLQNF